MSFDDTLFLMEREIINIVGGGVDGSLLGGVVGVWLGVFFVASSLLMGLFSVVLLSLCGWAFFLLRPVFSRFCGAVVVACSPSCQDNQQREGRTRQIVHNHSFIHEFRLETVAGRVIE